MNVRTMTEASQPVNEPVKDSVIEAVNEAVNGPGAEPAERDPQSTPPKGRDPIPHSPPQEDPPRERSNDEPGAPLPMIQDPPAPDANPIDPRVFVSR